MVKQRNTPPPERHQIEIEANGKTYKGYYTLGQKMITVNMIGGGSKTTQWSATGHHDALARIILSELVAQKA